MTADLISTAKDMSRALSMIADLLGNEQFMRRVIEIENNSHERELAKPNPHSYFRNHGIELPQEMEVTIGSFSACIKIRGEVYCMVINKNGIFFTKNGV
jgi:hypothetical protein